MNKHVIVVGGGWSGLSCAVHLTALGYRVTVLEAAKQLGGRARGTPMGTIDVDNGQHVLLGAYRHTLDLFKLLAIDETKVCRRLPLRIKVSTAQGTGIDLRVPVLPAPWHMLVALLRCQGIAWRDKYSGLRALRSVLQTQLTASTDISVDRLLKDHQVPTSLREYFLVPLCVAALNTQPEIASAAVFIHVLREAFKTARASSDMLIPTVNLSEVLPEPAYAYLANRGADIRLDCKVLALKWGRADGLNQVVLDNGCQLSAEHIVIATGYRPAYRLLSSYEPILGSSLQHFVDEPIVTLYYQFPASVQLDYPMLGLSGGMAEWVFDRGILGQPGLLAVVISATGPHLSLRRSQLSTAVLAELRQHLPELPSPEDILVLKESRATFSCRVGINAWRPANTVPIPGLWLAGDYTLTDLPATLEGAVKSGHCCARQIHSQYSKLDRDDSEG